MKGERYKGLLIFTDASYSTQTKVAGFGFVIVSGDYEYRAGNFALNCSDNNVAEIGAIASALKYCETLGLFRKSNDKTLTIITDSRTAECRINRHEQGRHEVEQGWLKFIERSIQRSGHKARVLQVKGHSKDDSKFSQYNEIADWIADDYRYLGEIEKKNQQYKSKRIISVYDNGRKGGR